MSNKPIGMFDSGVGGTSIFNEIHKIMPGEDIIYLADSKNAPYGEKSIAEIQNLSIKNTDLLLELGSKLIIVACNTATTNSIDLLRSSYGIPFIGIEPAIKPAALRTKTNAIGILATKGTLASSLFHSTTNLYGSGVKVIEKDGEGIVELIEGGKIQSQEMSLLLKSYLTPMVKAKIDHLVLGCTHYAYLIPIIKTILPQHVKIIDSGEAVAKQTKHILNINSIENTTQECGTCIFYTNGKIDVIKDLTSNSHLIKELDF